MSYLPIDLMTSELRAFRRLKTQNLDQLDQTAVKLGLFKGQYIVNKFCRNPDVDGPEDIWTGGGIYTGFPEIPYEELQVFSTSANDTLGGTGANTLRIYYLDENLEMFDDDENPLFFDIDLNGTTPVNTGIIASRVYRALVILSGSLQTSDGIIEIRYRTTTTVIFADIPARFGQTEIGNFTIPTGWRGVLKHASATMFDNNANRAEMAFKVKDFGSNTFRLIYPFSVTNDNSYSQQNYGGEVLGEKTDIVLRAISVQNANANIAGDYSIHLIKDGTF